jgi:hypothetical protein
VRDYHLGIKGMDRQGRPYHALDPDTCFWAHATFVMVPVLVCQHFGRLLTEEQKEQLYAEGLQWYRLYGVSDRPAAADWRGFCAYFDRVCVEVLEDNWGTRAVLNLRRIGKPPALGVPRRERLLLSEQHSAMAGAVAVEVLQGPEPSEDRGPASAEGEAHHGAGPGCSEGPGLTGPGFHGTAARRAVVWCQHLFVGREVVDVAPAPPGHLSLRPVRHIAGTWPSGRTLYSWSRGGGWVGMHPCRRRLTIWSIATSSSGSRLSEAR